MKTVEMDAIIVLGSIHRVLQAEKILGASGVEVDTIVTPRAVSADCGMVVALRSSDLDKAFAALEQANAGHLEIWTVTGGRYERRECQRPSSGRG